MTMQQELTDDQRRFFSTVLEYYQELAKESGDQAEDRFRAAEAAKKVALIQGTLGLYKRALRSFELSRDNFESLVSDFPRETKYRLGLAKSRLGWAVCRLHWRFSSEVERECRGALALVEELLEQTPDNLEYLLFRARAQFLLAVSLSEGGRDEDARQKAVQIIQDAARSLEQLADKRSRG